MYLLGVYPKSYIISKKDYELIKMDSTRLFQRLLGKIKK